MICNDDLKKGERVMPRICRLLTCLGLFLLVGFFFPYYQSNTLQGVNEWKFTLGVPSSPWLVVYRTDKKAGGFSQGQYIEFISWSSLLGIAGYGLIEASRRLRPKITLAPPT